MRLGKLPLHVPLHTSGSLVLRVNPAPHWVRHCAALDGLTSLFAGQLAKQVPAAVAEPPTSVGNDGVVPQPRKQVVVVDARVPPGQTVRHCVLPGVTTAVPPGQAP